MGPLLFLSLIHPENLDDAVAGAGSQVSAVKSKGHAAHTAFR
jgi:hypothetical protein